MSELEFVKNAAKKVLAIPSSVTCGGSFLWERAERFARTSGYICALVEMSETEVLIDRFCLSTACYFSEAGLAMRLRNEANVEILSALELNDEDLLEGATNIVSKKLGGTIDKWRIDKINSIITESANALTHRAEAMILSDARNLDDMGVTGIFKEFRRNIFRGEDMSYAIGNWQKKVDYRYWQARLKESFRFEQVREIAEQRLKTADAFIRQMAVESECSDLAELVSVKSRRPGRSRLRVH